MTQVKVIQMKSSKEYINSMDLRVSSEFLDKFDHTCKEILIKSAERAKANARNTVLGKDL